MSSFVKIFNVATGTPRYCDLRLSEGVSVGPTRDLMGAELFSEVALSKEGPVEECKAGGSYRMEFGNILPTTYHVFFTINPALFEFTGPVSKPDLIIPKEEAKLAFYFTAKKNFRPADFSHQARFFMVD
jgi:hypothetical protein